MAFLETPRFPLNISSNSDVTLVLGSTIGVLKSGHRKTNRDFDQTLREIDASFGVRSDEDLYDLLVFWQSIGGPNSGFRFRDELDYTTGAYNTAPTALDQPLGDGDGVETEFQLVKRYTTGAFYYERLIEKPVVGTVLIGVDGIPEVSGWTVDTTNGIVTFSTPPPNGTLLTSGCEFDIPCAFTEDRISRSIEEYLGGNTKVLISQIRELT